MSRIRVKNEEFLEHMDLSFKYVKSRLRVVLRHVLKWRVY